MTCRFKLFVIVLVPLLISVVARAQSCDYSVLTAHNNSQRTGTQLCESALTPQTAPYVQKVAQRTDIGKITGQPLLLHGNKVNGVIQDALIVAANPYAPNDTPSVSTVYFLHPATLGILARIDLSVPGYCTVPNNDENKPWDGCYGVHSTPVIDRAADILYFLDARKNNSNVSEYALLSYDINSMTQVASAVISGTCNSGQSFSGPYDQSQTTLLQRQRPALLLDHGHIYVAFGSGNDENAAYNGWVFAYNTYSGQPVLTPAGNPYCTSRSTIGFDAWGEEESGRWVPAYPPIVRGMYMLRLVTVESMTRLKTTASPM